ncbi:MAG TPA: oxidative damage protection protein [Longimicrobiales bacterium]|nr:oxidative damage protection protein [Longimicrobiales bacterium]
METIECRRCGEEAPPLAKPPFRNDLGERIRSSICRGCWSEWLQHQTLLINHYGLDVRDPESREFLFEQIEKVLLEGGEGAEVDTSREGEVDW